ILVKRNEHIRDRLVVGIRDKELSRRLQLRADLTLEQAVLMARQTEEVAEQITQQEQQTSLSVQAVERRGHAKKGERPQAEGSERTQQDNAGDYKCRRCGKERHKNATKCPAMESECRK